MIREYRAGDLFKIKVQPAQEDEALAVKESDFLKLKAYTLSEGKGGGVLAAFGFREAADGRTAECFALIGRNARAKLFEAVRFWQREIASVMAARGIRRVTMTVRSSFAAGERLARLLGFYPAERLENFFNGNDYQLFERIKQDESGIDTSRN